MAPNRVLPHAVLAIRARLVKQDLLFALNVHVERSPFQEAQYVATALLDFILQTLEVQHVAHVLWGNPVLLAPVHALTVL
jgi:hypothetical protein